jgi:glycosyltransferase involved in cell wall biosynthesis
MIIDAYTFCWNEEIRLRYFLNHYSPVCRRIVVFDNGSTDSSQEVASQYGNVVWDTETYGQGEIDDDILRDVKNNCWKDSRDADLVFVGDVDEVLYHPSGGDYFRSALQTGYTVFRATAYDMVSRGVPVHLGNIYDDADFRYGVRSKQNTKDPLPCHMKGDSYYNGTNGLDKDDKLAFRHWLEGAKLGSVQCMKNVVWSYSAGIGVELDIEKANQWQDIGKFAQEHEGSSGSGVLDNFRYDKSLVFSPSKIQEINYVYGAHFAKPTGDVRELYDGELKLLHYKFLGEEFFCKRMRESGARLSSLNIEKGHGGQYLMDDDKNRELYREMFAKRERVL